MRSFLSTVVLTASFALLVPDNHGARAVDAVDASRPYAVAAVVGAPGGAERAIHGTPEGDPDVAWLLALGFLGAVMARRLRAD